MRLLALDAALGPCSVALLVDGTCLDVRCGGDSRAATVSLPVLVQGMLAQHGRRFDAVGVTVGPGSFTGLRGALSLAHGLAAGAGVPIVGVTVAEALLAADPSPSERMAWVALDSRREGRIFLGTGAAMQAVFVAGLPVPDGPVQVFGDAAPVVAQALRDAGADAVCASEGRIDAALVGQVALRRLAGDIPACDALPLYVEPPEARAAVQIRPAPV